MEKTKIKLTLLVLTLIISLTLSGAAFATENIAANKSADRTSCTDVNVTIEVTGSSENVTNAADVVFAIDSSGSMRTSDPTGLRKTAVINFINKLDPTKDKVGVVNWDNVIRQQLALTNNYTQAINVVNQGQPGSTTNGALAIQTSTNLLGASTLPTYQRFIILLTDGQFNEGGGTIGGQYLDPDQMAIYRAQQAAALGYTIYTVGLGADVDPNVLTTIATVTGGKYYFAVDAQSLDQIYNDIFKEITKVATDIQVTDVIPSYMNYVNGSATIAPTTNVLNPDGTRTLTWYIPRLGQGETWNVTYHQVIDPLKKYGNDVPTNVQAYVDYTKPNDEPGNRIILPIPEVDFPYASIGDLVWEDLNANGMYDIGEPGVPNVLVKLYNSTGTQLDTTVTDANGNYYFNNLIPGNYYLNFSTPAGYYISPFYGAGYDNKANPTTGNTAIFNLVCGEQDYTWDAGIYKTATVGDYVWNDQNADGIYQGNGYGIPGVTVTLYHSNGSVAGTTNTDANGYYFFTNLVPGDYYVGFTIPSGFIVSPKVPGDQTNKANALGITDTFTLTSGQTDLTWDCGMYQLASIGDFVWDDLNADGIWQSGEPGLNNIAVQLYNSITDLLVTSTTTNASGYYLFNNLVPGNYYVKFIKPAGYNFSPSFQAGAIYSTADQVTGKTPNIYLTSGQSQLQWDAGMYPNATIGDLVWLDLNYNGYIDPGEPGLPGIIVKLYSDTMVLLQTTSTDASGLYGFSVLPGSYYLQFIAPPGYAISPYIPGVTDNTANTTTGFTTLITINAGESQDYWDAGMLGYEELYASVGDFVWNDQNADGIYQGNGMGIDGINVTLYYANGTVAGTTTTSGGGFYLFTGLLPGNYYVGFSIPSGFIVSPIVPGDQTNKANASGFTQIFYLAPGQTDLTWDCGMYQLASIGDFVWDDLNADGIWQSGEPGLNNVTVELYNSITDLLVTSTTTNASGYYLFNNLTPGNYYVLFNKPDSSWNYSPCFQAGAIYSTACSATGKTPNITLTSGQNQLQWDAGMYQNALIGDYVWDDLNVNGDIDAGEPPLAGVNVNLYDGTGQILQTTSTDANGFYSFSVLPGSYYLEFIKPTGYNISFNYGPGYDNQANPISGLTATTTLVSGENQDYWDAGMWMPASIGQFVWNDQNANGIFDGRGTGLPNVRVELYDEQGGYHGFTYTDSNGFYSFTNLIPGSYYLWFELLPGFTFSPVVPGDQTNKAHPDGFTSPVTLYAGENNPYIDAGMYEPVTIGSYVWNDLNRNGLRDPGEPGIPGVTVELYNGVTYTLVNTTITDASGNYLFSNEIPNFYYVKFIKPDGYTFTLQDVGNDPSINSSAYPPTGESATREYTSGTVYLNVNAGLYQEAADLIITKTVYPEVVYVGDIITYTIVVTNLGPDTAVNTRVTDDMPESIIILDYDPSMGDFDPETGIWTIGDLEKDQTATLTITARTTQTGKFTNTAVVESDTYDPNPDNSDSATVTVIEKPKPPCPPVHGKTVPMQPTGTPLGSMILALLVVFSGYILARKK
ncbi:MAG: carboxypeptidase regulatory-like domain-containing protein [Methanobacterium sp.]|nr:carboxypeptidase regulatory-like domain-containing protein [Methanobacterium sp.]